MPQPWLSGWLIEAEGVEEIQLFRLLSCQACRGCRSNSGDVLVECCEKIQRAPRARGIAFRFQPQAHDAPEHEGKEADQGMGADAVGQPMMDGRDLDVGFQDAKAALDVGERLVAGDGFRRCTLHDTGLVEGGRIDSTG